MVFKEILYFYALETLQSRPGLKRLLLIVSFFLLILPSFAQKRTTHWYLGRNVGLNFQNTTPSSHTNGRQDAFEASASISDLSGNLLFYTDGSQIWNKDNTLIQNGTGINCDNSATQGALFIPKPGSKTIFYLFTLDNASTNNAFNLYYSEIDLSLNNGLGGVSSNKNVLVRSGVSERLAATWKADGSGIWLAVRDASSAYFHTFLVTAQGIQLTAISTAAGSATSTTGGVQAGQMKFTPDGRYLAWACKGDRFLEVLQFNSENGTFNSSYSRKAVFTTLGPYGVEFSNSGNFLYVSLGALGIYQYDMGKLMTETLFRSSKIQISSTTAYGMQLAKNGAIYVANYSYSLHAILSPTLAGTACDYEANAVYLGSGFSRDGMPSFVSTYFLDKPIVSSDSCVGNDVRFTFRMETGDSMRWYFGDPASVSNTSNDPTPVHVYTIPGNYEITLYMYHDGGVQETYKHTIHIHGFPQFTLGPDTTICYGQQYLLSPSVTFASYLWQDGKTQSVLSVLNTGTYHVRIEKNGCASFDTVDIVIDKPQVELLVSSENGCANQNAFNFNIDQPGTLSGVSWTFGDGATSGNRQTAHSYAGAGTYDVKVQTTNNVGCVAKAEIQVIVKELVPALLNVNATEQCFSGHVFEAAFAGNPDDGNLLTYAILFSDGYLKKDEGASHSFAAPGIKTVRLITTSKEFCKDTATVKLEVLADPVARFTVDSSLNCQANNRITVNGFSSVSANGSIVSWKFESNSTQVSGVQTSFSYPSGSFPVYLQVEDAKGCKAATTRVVNVYPNPVVDFKLNENSNCIGTNPVKATNLTSISSGTVTSYLWDFGDGETSDQFEPEKQFGEANTYIVRLTATSGKGCQASTTRNIVTYEVPVADFQIVNFEACLNENRLDIINKAGIKGNDALTYEWNLDGDILTEEDIINYRFTSEGPKLVTLKVTSEKGCVNEMQTSVMLLPSPKVDFIVNQPVQCLTENKFLVLFDPQIETSPIESVVWRLGDGRVFDGPDATFSYTESGVYPFELEVKNMAGCVSTAIGNTIVSPQPKASFSADPVCVSSSMNFVNNSSISGGSIVSYSWFFGDNHQSQNKDPQHKFAESGEYPVLLEVSSDMGCKDYLVQKVQVKSEPVASFQYRKYGYKQDLGETIYEFVCNDPAQGHVVNWFVKGQKVATGERAFIGFEDTGYYDVTMLVENGAGCPASFNQSVFVIPPFELFLPTAFSPNKDGINETFRPEGNSYIGQYEMIVVNRWGSVIFQSHSAEQGWDGTFSGAESEPGMYIYYIKLTDIEGEEWEFKGTVILIR